MELTKYSDGIKTLMVQHECRRCGKTYLEKLETAMKRSSEVYRVPNDIYIPPEWEKVGWCLVMCKECYAEYEEFIDAGKKKVIMED